MSIRTALKVVPNLPITTSILFRGNHGIGKSQIVRQIAGQIAKKHGLKEFPVIDRRLSQVTEGDIIGLPSTDGNVTRFNPPDWYKTACERPCALFLDELNRATPEVMQAAFQIVLDRELNGWKLHPQTWVTAAINSAGQYNVNEVDPALLDRFWCIDLDPDTKDWLDWAREDNRVAQQVIDFIVSNEKFLDPIKNAPEASAVQPSRRSWERLSQALVGAGIHEDVSSDLFYPMCLGYVGTEATIAFHDFVKHNDMRVSGDELLNDYKKVEAKVKKFNIDQQNAAIEKLAEAAHKLTKLTDKQGKNLSDFVETLGEELRVNCWSKLTEKGTDNLTLAKSVHKYMVKHILDVFQVPLGEAGVGVVPNIPGIFKQKQEEAKKK
jgi:hypothetical protein